MTNWGAIEKSLHFVARVYRWLLIFEDDQRYRETSRYACDAFEEKTKSGPRRRGGGRRWWREWGDREAVGE